MENTQRIDCTGVKPAADFGDEEKQTSKKQADVLGMESLSFIPDCGKIKSEMDLRHQTFMDVCHDLHKLHVEKDTRYNGSFHKTYRKYGMTATAIRLGDKFERFEQLLQNPDVDPLDESMEDTIRDFANYAIMTLVELRLKKLGL
jgi:hypothetical protein